MSLNCAEIDKILEELDLEGSYIQKLVQSSYSGDLFRYALPLYPAVERGSEYAACR